MARGKSIDPLRIVRVYNDKMNQWPYDSTEYWTHDNKAEIRKTFDDGLLKLTGASTVQEAWLALLPGYVDGQKFVFKHNMNCYDTEEPLTSRSMSGVVVDSLHENLGVAHDKIKILDVVRRWPNGYRADWAAQYPQVEMVRQESSSVITGGWYEDEQIVFFDGNVPDHRIPNYLFEADHMINLYLVKSHNGYITGAMKNHYGSQEKPSELHGNGVWRRPRCIAYIGSHHFFRDRERLQVGEGFFLSQIDENDIYTPLLNSDFFPTGRLNSLFLSTNPVVCDRVVHDFVNAERSYLGLYEESIEFLEIATTEFASAFGNAPIDVPEIVGGTFTPKDFSYPIYDYISYEYKKPKPENELPNFEVTKPPRR